MPPWDLVAAAVTKAERHPDADKLYVLHLDDGSEVPRIICSGLVEHYTLEDLEGRSIIVVGNLKPAKFKGIPSNGMLLAAEDDAGAPGAPHPEGQTRR